MAHDAGQKSQIKAGFGVTFMVCTILTMSAVCARAQSASPTSTVPEAIDFAKLDAGQVSKNIYHNAQLGFRYEFPRGWIVNDKATQRRTLEIGHQFIWSDDSPIKGEKRERPCTRDLLLVSQYPEEMRTGGINPTAFLIAADPRCAPGVTFPATLKDNGAIQQVASHLGIYFKTLHIISKSPARIRAFENAGRVMLEVSQSYSFYLNEPGNARALGVDSSVLVMQAHDYWVMWMFIGDGDADLDRMRKSKIFLDTAPESTR